MVSRKGHQREPTELVITEYCSDLAHRPVPLRPIRPYQVIVHAPILYPLRINPRGVPAGRLRNYRKKIARPWILANISIFWLFSNARIHKAIIMTKPEHPIPHPTAIHKGNEISKNLTA